MIVRMSKPNPCDALGTQHEWDEEDYSYRCINCGLFFPYGCAPWEEDDIARDNDAVAALYG